MRPSLRRTIALLAAVLLLVSAAGLAMAQETLLGGKLRAGDNVTLPAGESVDGDLYLFAGMITVDGDVDGDLVAFGGQIQLNGNVTGDVLIAGGTLTITGSVEGDVRSAGGTLTVGGPIGEDLVSAGGTSTLTSAGAVGGDVIVTGGTVALAGNVEGSVAGSAGTYSRTGSVGGTEEVIVGDDEEEEEEDAAAATGDRVLDAIRHFVVLLLLGALALWLLPRLLRAADGTLRERPLASLGGGLLTFVGYILLVVGIAIVMILLGLLFGVLQLGALVALEIITGILALGIATFLFVVAVAYVADIVVALALARLVAPRRMASRWQELGLLAAGLAAVVIVTSLPVIGGIAKLAVILFGLGALAVVFYRAWRSGRRTPPVAKAPMS